VSNAGIRRFGRLDEITTQDFDRVFSVNIRGQLFAIQHAARHLPDGGRIVLTPAVSATRAIFYQALCATSKDAVNSMVLNLSPELGGRGITINAVAPGGAATDTAIGVPRRSTIRWCLLPGRPRSTGDGPVWSSL
jgi:NAD(P)-dependent dehydrogenase (short-subunit alcohol dehydrogenase family)